MQRIKMYFKSNRRLCTVGTVVIQKQKHFTVNAAYWLMSCLRGRNQSLEIKLTNVKYE